MLPVDAEPSPNVWLVVGIHSRAHMRAIRQRPSMHICYRDTGTLEPSSATTPSLSTAKNIWVSPIVNIHISIEGGSKPCLRLGMLIRW